MPCEKYSGMAQKDLKGLIAYLHTLKSAKQNHARAKTVGALGALAIADYIKSIPAIKNQVK
ncbi:MAG: hypothetical protein HW419_3370 [Deltaproteobacteria bacterium]|nr:hypothetical protein [Deltaproteobacteria bacterium]